MNKYLIKIAQTEEQRPHVDEARDKFAENEGMLLHWSTGSGKTKHFLEETKRALDNQPGKRALIVAPASLVSNVDKELKKHKIKLDRKRLDVMSYEMAVNRSGELSKNRYSIAVADEAQKLRNTNTQRSQVLSEILSKADRRLLATATGNYNRAADIAPLMNIAAGHKVLPEDEATFNNRYLAKVKRHQSMTDRLLKKPPIEDVVLRNKKELAEVFRRHVHYYDSMEDTSAQDKFPSLTEKTIECEMSPKQLQHYKYVEGDLPFMLRMKVRQNLSLNAKERAQLNSFSSGVRQASNSYRHLLENEDEAEFTPKIEEAVKNLKTKKNGDKNFRAMVYSNYLKAGVNEYSRKLKSEGIEHQVYTGKLTPVEKDAMVKKYNEGKSPVLLVSSSGAEGLDLKGTKLIQVMEPHFNPSKIAQVIGRGRRYESHEHLPVNERNVDVEHYLSVHPKHLGIKAPTSIDKYLSLNSDGKEDVFSQIRDVMKENS